MSEIVILAEGYSKDVTEKSMRANCSSVVVKDHLLNIIVDTMTPWDRELIQDRLLTRSMLRPSEIHFVVNTHGHSDHTGNNNLFLKAKLILGDSVSQGDLYEFINLKDSNWKISPNVEIQSTPGHTMECISVKVTNCKEYGTVFISGDLFENENDIKDPSIWIAAGSANQELQRKNRNIVAQAADYIIPGHGPMFKVTSEHRKLLAEQIQ